MPATESFLRLNDEIVNELGTSTMLYTPAIWDMSRSSHRAVAWDSPVEGRPLSLVGRVDGQAAQLEPPSFPPEQVYRGYARCVGGDVSNESSWPTPRSERPDVSSAAGASVLATRSGEPSCAPARTFAAGRSSNLETPLDWVQGAATTDAGWRRVSDRDDGCGPSSEDPEWAARKEHGEELAAQLTGVGWPHSVKPQALLGLVEVVRLGLGEKMVLFAPSLPVRLPWSGLVTIIAGGLRVGITFIWNAYRKQTVLSKQ
ncbi:uncharacterized protein L3040_008568 [Drepanopeziza brunnea f. sp. 'multigermtubi']|uniref:Uncharacterized protein n=1 Tax=Marssonina brunnea f. sp. multigermtubi (strain MB_m1) TaxID=1072389 RepID=K1XH69_MARBU|nr:uncharacterized protein MBM_10039 [Drepanopeziza brunnea f. sp. 'multigermtubi' MB_m1]EKD11809.1 hypothetical protein MBM_10039 [Drepanopeziza brunnea f. sp. 'multigermtubi' MB_m1]KAJ5033453.1 hypothetical protein L3040_008568 [Drepanopeziza brunnea f. sp. 'multigermtubi']